MLFQFERNSYLLRDPGDIPARDAFRVPDDDFKVLELDHGDSVKSHIQEHQRPFEEGVGGISWISLAWRKEGKDGQPYRQLLGALYAG